MLRGFQKKRIAQIYKLEYSRMYRSNNNNKNTIHNLFCVFTRNPTNLVWCEPMARLYEETLQPNIYFL